MANKTTVSTEVKHAILDIEIEIDTAINSRVQTVKDDYNDTVKEFKLERDVSIKEIRAEKRTMMKKALENLVSNEEA